MDFTIAACIMIYSFDWSIGANGDRHGGYMEMKIIIATCTAGGMASLVSWQEPVRFLS